MLPSWSECLFSMTLLRGAHDDRRQGGVTYEIRARCLESQGEGERDDCKSLTFWRRSRRRRSDAAASERPRE